MMEAVFQAPKRRTKVYESFEAPLPISLSAEDEEHIIYRAEIISHHVIVTNPAHIQPIYERGYFGKGVFSRSRPEHMISQQWKYIGDRCLPVISSSEYQKRLSWARAALLMQGLEEESVNRALETLTKPVEFDIEKEHRRKPEAKGFDGSSMDDVSCDTVSNLENDSLDQTDTARPQRQGNPLYDPLAEIYPQEPELLKANVKCKRHDDWLTHCGCRPDEDQLMSSECSMADADPSEAYEYVLVEVSEDDDSENFSKDNVSAVNNTSLLFLK